MKSRALIWPVLFVLVLMMLAGCSDVTEPVADNQALQQEQDKITEEAETAAETDDEELISGVDVMEVAGTWTNPEYNGEGRSAMVVFEKNSDDSYTYTAYDNADGSGTVYRGMVNYKQIWTDDQGRRVGRSKVELENGMSWDTLDRISLDGSTMEVQSGVEEIDPGGPRYSIYYR